MRITVKTGAANKFAPDVTDDLLTTTEAALERGKMELYSQVDAYLTTLNLPMTTLIETGELVEVHNLQTNEVYRGLVTSVSINITELDISQTVELERPA